MNSLNASQLQVLRAIADLCNELGCSPTFREIAERCGCSLTVASNKVEVLSGLGFIRRRSYAHRSIEITAQGWEALGEADTTDYLI